MNEPFHSAIFYDNNWGDTNVDRQTELVDWQTEILAKFLKVVIAQRTLRLSNDAVRANDRSLTNKEQAIAG